MPFLAVCPYCNIGRIRAPEKALGLTAPCPNCKTSFTVVDSGLVDAEPVPISMSGESEPIKPVPATAPAPVFRAPAMRSAPMVSHVANHEEEDGHTFDPLRVPTLLAFTLAGVALVASQIPYGRSAQLCWLPLA